MTSVVTQIKSSAEELHWMGCQDVNLFKISLIDFFLRAHRSVRFTILYTSFLGIVSFFSVFRFTIRFIIEVIEEIVEEYWVGQSEDDGPAWVAALIEEKLRRMQESDAELELEEELFFEFII